MRVVLLSTLIFTLLGGASAFAGCREDIQALMKASEEETNFRLETEMLMGGRPVQHTVQYYKDYSHFYQEVKETGVKWLLLGNQEYMATDGGALTPYQTREPDWLEKSLAAGKLSRETISEPECGTETRDGKDYLKYAHTQVNGGGDTGIPESVTRSTVWVDPDTGKPAFRNMVTDVGGQQIESNITIFYEEITLPTP